MGIQKYNTETYQDKLNSIFPNLTLIEHYTNYDDKLLHHCSICNGNFLSGAKSTLRGKGCPYCKNRKVLIGFNDIQTTHPEIADLLVNKSDKTEYIYGTNKKLLFKCKECGSEYKSSPKFVTERTCKFCRDKVSLSEKLMKSFLEQLNVKYIHQLSNKTFDWCRSYRYDFYFEYNNKSYIIETNGSQHYVDRPTFDGINHLKENQKNDYNKKILALNYVDNYIVLNCSDIANQDFKNIVENSLLSKIFDISKVSFKQCYIDTLSSTKIDVCKDFNNGMTSKQLREKYNLSKTAVCVYLKFGKNAGICEYDETKSRLDATRKSVICLNNLTVYDSVYDASKKTGVSYGSISDSCKNHRELSHYKTDLTKWMYYDEYKSIKEMPVYFNNDKSRMKVRCINTGEIFDSLKQATDWCGTRGIEVALKNPNRTCGKHPITHERLKWEYV